MADMTYRRDATGLLVVDPYNDFISDGGKVWPRVREVVEANGCIPHMLQILTAARSDDPSRKEKSRSETVTA